MYGICFENGERVAKWELSWEERKGVTESMSFGKETRDPRKAKEQRRVIEAINTYHEKEMGDAISAGSDQETRIRHLATTAV